MSGLSARDEWRWTDEQGVQRLVRTEELRAALASNVLPPSTLVWREGMSEWVPAFTVPELATGLGATRTGRPATPAKPTTGQPPPRGQLQTLVGLASPDGDRPSGPHAPIVVPSATQAKAAGITQQPRFDAESSGQSADVTIPRAPRVPSAEPKATTPAAYLKTQPGMGVTAERKARTSEIDALWSGAGREENTSTDTLVRPEPKGAQDKDAPATAAEQPPRAPGASPPTGTPLEEVTADTDPDASETLAASAARTPVPGATRPRPPPIRKTNPAPGTGRPPAPMARRPSTRPPGPPPKPLAMLSAKPATTPATTNAPEPQPRPPTDTGAGAAPATKQSKPPPPPIARAQARAAEAKTAESKPADTKAAEPKPTAAKPTQAKPEAKPTTQDPKPERPAPPPPPSIDPIPPQSLQTPVSAAPPLVGKLQAPSSSLPATAPPATAQSDKESIQVGVSTANMPALVDPAASSWLVQTTTTGDGQAGGGAKKDLSTTAVMATATSARASERPPPAEQERRQPMATERPPPPAAGASERPPPIPSDLPPTFGPDAYARRPSQRPPGSLPPLREMVRPEHLSDPVEVPFSSLLGAAGTLIVMVVSAFLVGRCSIVADANAGPTKAESALGLLPLIARAAVPPLPKPCWVARQPVMWAPIASKNIPFELMATDKGTLAIGYAKTEREAIGIDVEPAGGQVTQRFSSDKLEADVDRVSPAPNGETYLVSAAGAALRSVVQVSGDKPFLIGMAKDDIALADAPDSATSTLWAAPRSDPKTLRAQRVLDRGTLVVVRRDGGVFGGWVGPDRRPVGALTPVVGSGGAVGRPMTGQNRRDVAVVFADRPRAGAKWEIRVGTAPAGKVPESTTVIPLPKGGPGGDAFAPDIAGLPDGRWLLVWTEGAPGSRALRALTLESDLTPIGDPIALSPPAGNFGQGALGVVGDYAAAVFLQKGASSFELWGAILQCG